ncbi:pseudouridine synthase [Shewanella surugensis]|uniref:Pseudouridine synthase n=1 Tax=Shewanella surugensis TaxID=212020 RepID=A0ABT0LG77_9GAMM|nr:pseudouridine synthase [Shewanella surugensis]MCL1126701.1 pseudouridine synthase [Shewanella surugensis]
MSTGVRAKQASHIVLPETVIDKKTVLDFLICHFNQIPAGVWRQRIMDGKVHWRNGELIDVDTLFIPRERVYYYREVNQESLIPFKEDIVYQDQHIIVAYKPAFLAVNPSGQFINECLVNRLRERVNNPDLVAVHRLDRATSGLMLMSLNKDSRHDYHQLFKMGMIMKQYHALASLTPKLLADHEAGELVLPLYWTIKNRMVKGAPSFLMKIIEGEANTHSEICLIAIKEGVGLFLLKPITGKTHQLRVHMQSLGMSLLNDGLYPTLQDQAPDNFTRPLKLMAKRLCFIDPITQIKHDISCKGFAEFV